MAINHEKNIRIQTTLSIETKELIQQIAKENKKTLSKYIAALIENDIQKKIDTL